MDFNDFSQNELLEELKRMEKIIIVQEFLQKSLGHLKMPPIKSLDQDCKLSEVIELMQENNFGSVVITKEGKLAGIITERDILKKVVGKIKEPAKAIVKDVMTANPICFFADDKVAYVINSMHKGGFRHIPIVNRDFHPLSVVSIKDILSYLIEQFPNEINMLPETPYRGPQNR